MYSRAHPFLSRIKERYLLTGPTSSKKTYHIALDITDSKIDFQVGDSLAVLPSNDPQIVLRILQLIQASGEEEIFDIRSNASSTLNDYLLHKANLSRVNSSFFKILCEKEGKTSELLIPENKSQLATYLQSHTLVDLLNHHKPTSPFSPSEFCKPLMPLMPRFYSIASSPKVYPDEIHLTVAHVSYLANGQIRYGVGTHFLCDQADLGNTPIPIYIQPSNHFTLPSDPNASIILIGPGTGIAPFRAFLQERIALQSPGRNWVFFGERNRASDFYYADFWLDLEKQGRIRLDLAFSRDQSSKIYVQHRILEQKKTIWNWLETGCYIYVCGDAEEMAKDVDQALHQIAKEEGGLTEEASRQYIKSLRTSKKYLLDVY